jgi:hypothetical protein
VPYDETWFILIDNSFSSWSNKAVTVSLTLNPNRHYSPTNDSDMTVDPLAILGIIVIVVVAIGLLAHASKQSQRKTNAAYFKA